MRRTILSAGLAVLCILAIAGTSAALLPEMTKEELIANSEAIVLGTVRDVQCAWAEDRSSIYTYVTLDIGDQFMGKSVGNELVVQIPGGRVGDIIQKVSDTPTLTPGMEIILHTFMQETGYPWIYGWEKGVLTVEQGTVLNYMMTLEQFQQLVENTTK